MFGGLNLKSLQDRLTDSLHDLEHTLSAATTPPAAGAPQPATTSSPTRPPGSIQRAATSPSPSTPRASLAAHATAPSRPSLEGLSSRAASLIGPLSPTASAAQQSASQLADSALSSLRASLRKGRASLEGVAGVAATGATPPRPSGESTTSRTSFDSSATARGSPQRGTRRTAGSLRREGSVDSVREEDEMRKLRELASPAPVAPVKEEPVDLLGADDVDSLPPSTGLNTVSNVPAPAPTPSSAPALPAADPLSAPTASTSSPPRSPALSPTPPARALSPVAAPFVPAAAGDRPPITMHKSSLAPPTPQPESAGEDDDAWGMDDLGTFPPTPVVPPPSEPDPVEAEENAAAAAAEPAKGPAVEGGAPSALSMDAEVEAPSAPDESEDTVQVQVAGVEKGDLASTSEDSATEEVPVGAAPATNDEPAAAAPADPAPGPTVPEQIIELHAQDEAPGHDDTSETPVVKPLPAFEPEKSEPTQATQRPSDAPEGLSTTAPAASADETPAPVNVATADEPVSTPPIALDSDTGPPPGTSEDAKADPEEVTHALDVIPPSATSPVGDATSAGEEVDAHDPAAVGGAQGAQADSISAIRDEGVRAEAEEGKDELEKGDTKGEKAGNELVAASTAGEASDLAVEPTTATGDAAPTESADPALVAGPEHASDEPAVDDPPVDSVEQVEPSSATDGDGSAEHDSTSTSRAVPATGTMPPVETVDAAEPELPSKVAEAVEQEEPAAKEIAPLIAVVPDATPSKPEAALESTQTEREVDATVAEERASDSQGEQTDKEATLAGEMRQEAIAAPMATVKPQSVGDGQPPSLSDSKSALKRIVSTYLAPLEDTEDLEAVEAALANLKRKEELATQETKRLTSQLERRKEAVEELRETHRLEHKSQHDEIESLRAQLADKDARLAAAEAAASQTRDEVTAAAAEYDKLKIVAKEEEEKRIKALSLLRALRQKLVKNEQEKGDADRLITEARASEKQAQETLKSDRARFDSEIVALRAAQEQQVNKLKQSFERETANLKAQYERDATNKKGQFELNAITAKAQQAKEMSAREARIQQLEATVRELSAARDGVFTQLQARQAEIESSSAQQEALKTRAAELEYEAAEQRDRVAALQDEVDDLRRHRHDSAREEGTTRRLLDEAETRHAAKVRDLEARAARLERDRREIEDEMGRNLQDRLREVERLRAALAKKDVDFADSVQNSQKREKEIDEAQKARAEVEKRLKTVEASLEALRSDAERARQGEAAAKEELSDRLLRANELEARLEEVQTRESNLRSANKVLREELRKLQSGLLLAEKQRQPGVGYFASISQQRAGDSNPALASTTSLASPPLASTPASVAPAASATGQAMVPNPNGNADEAISYEYLRNVVLQFLERPEMRPQLVQVLGVILQFTPVELRRLAAKAAAQ